MTSTDSNDSSHQASDFELLTHAEAAQKLRVSKSTVIRLVKTGELAQIRVGERPDPQTPGKMTRGSPRIPALAIRKYIDSKLGYDGSRTVVCANPIKEVKQWPKYMKDQKAAITGRDSKTQKVTGLDALLKSRKKRS